MAQIEKISEFIDHGFFGCLDDNIEEPNKILIEILKIFNVISDGILVTDLDDKIYLINKNHQLLTFLKPNDILGKSAFDLTRRYKYWTKASDFDVFQMKQDLKPRDYKMVTQYGQELLVTATPVLNDLGKPTWLVFTSRDIGQIRNMEKRLKRKTILPLNEERPPNKELNQLIGVSKAMKEIISIVERVSRTNCYVFLTGESGVGKDRIARQIHMTGLWASQPFIHVNCASIPETLFESEMFGYEKGSFTGASNEGKVGLLEMANGGTLYLDEITEMTISQQAKLLQVLQERTFRRVGGTKNLEFNARVISSSNRDIQEIITGKGFRQDLYYRLCVIPIFIPPLRERKEDILELIKVFMKEYSHKHGQHKILNEDVPHALQKHPWPGNIRELQHVIERLVIMTNSDSITMADCFPLDMSSKSFKPDYEDLLRNSVEKVEIDLIRKASKSCKNTREAARSLGISQATFLRKVKKYKISVM
ncbi:MAG: hypothetical protein APF81_01230 [Desulfosporosinus sp. BRH_c37]|nr:MAG: hypothetical protein APF81_01230 [Desulfosporosinus sp. BRH_c37]